MLPRYPGIGPLQRPATVHEAPAWRIAERDWHEGARRRRIGAVILVAAHALVVLASLWAVAR